MSADTKRRFHYEAFDCDIHIEIDTNVLTAETAAEINQFLSDAEYRLEICDGDVYRVVGRMFALAAFFYMRQIGGAFIYDEQVGTEFVKGILEHQHEGWPTFEDLGIQILDAHVPSMDFTDLDEQEVFGEPDHG